MPAIQTLNYSSLFDTLVSLTAAFVLGGLIGLERQYRQRTAGLRTIMREEGNVRGLNTAATLWCSAAVGACSGAGLVVEAIMGTLFVLAANTLLRPIVDQINRQPLDVTSAEVTNSVYVVTRSDRQKEALVLLEQELEDRNYPTRDLEVLPFGERNVKIQATLAATSVDGAVMDIIVAHLSALPMVRQAYWSASTTE